MSCAITSTEYRRHLPGRRMQIPLYIQTEYGNIPYGTGSIADCGCGPTAFAW